MIINGREIRELWMVQFASKKNTGGKQIQIEDIVVGMRFWASTGDEAVKLAQSQAEKERLPWLGLVGVVRLEVIESHIVNQPKIAGENQPQVQPFSGPVPLPPPTLTEEQNQELQQSVAAEFQDEMQGRPATEEEVSQPSGLIVAP